MLSQPSQHLRRYSKVYSQAVNVVGAVNVANAEEDTNLELQSLAFADSSCGGGGGHDNGEIRIRRWGPFGRAVLVGVDNGECSTLSLAHVAVAVHTKSSLDSGMLDDT